MVNLSERDVQSVLSAIQSIRIDIDEHTAPLLALSERLLLIERTMNGHQESASPTKTNKPRRQVAKLFSFLEGKIFARTIFLLSVAWQALNLVLVEAVEDWEAESWTAVLWTMLAFQLVHVLFMVVVSVKLVHQVIHRSVNILFIIQSYLSTIVMFGGVYTLMYALSVPPHSVKMKWSLSKLIKPPYGSRSVSRSGDERDDRAAHV